MSDSQFELPDDAAVDFREAAVRESLRIVQENRGAIPADRSLCLPTADANPDALAALGWGLVVLLIMGLGLMAGGCMFGYASEKQARDGDAAVWKIALALTATVGGIGLLCGGPYFQRRFTRRQIGTRYDALVEAGGKPRWAGIEEAITFHRMKFVPDDVGFVTLDAAQRLIRIEGIRHRYWIHGDDVLSVGQIPGSTSTATAIAFQVGSAQLAISLQSNSLGQELKRQLGGGKRDPLLREVQETLGRQD